MRTDTGVVRQRNEDAVGADPDAGIVILADGMGGANAGDVASNLAVNL
ncbi:protein phosphatase, partial [Candidatus Endoriftia persephone str. Guaymas]|nr:protein phosphatase [Candidatus Endoriftia persephone str. Guaymas]